MPPEYESPEEKVVVADEYTLPEASIASPPRVRLSMRRMEVEAVPEAVKLVLLAFVEKRLVAVSAVEEAYGIVVAPVREKNEEVARAVGTPEAPVTLARMEFAAIAVRPAEPLVYVMPLLKVVVAELNFEKKAEVRQPKTDAEAVSQVVLPEAYVRPVEKVVVATPVHVPPEKAKT